MQVAVFHKRRNAALARLDRFGSSEPIRVAQGKPAPRECTLDALHPTAPRHDSLFHVERAKLRMPDREPAFLAPAGIVRSIIPVDSLARFDEAERHARIRQQWLILPDGEPHHVCDPWPTAVRRSRADRDIIRAQANRMRDVERIAFDRRAFPVALSGFHAQFCAPAPTAQEASEPASYRRGFDGVTSYDDTSARIKRINSRVSRIQALRAQPKPRLP